MRDHELRTRLATCFAAVFPDITESEIPTASIVSVSAWDSLATVTLITLVEEEFQVGVTPENVAHFISFEMIADFLGSEDHA